MIGMLSRLDLSPVLIVKLRGRANIAYERIMGHRGGVVKDAGVA